jgi:hypothetical protein
MIIAGAARLSHAKVTTPRAAHMGRPRLGVSEPGYGRPVPAGRSADCPPEGLSRTSEIPQRRFSCARLESAGQADVAQLVEHQLPKLRVVGSSPIVRSRMVDRKPACSAGSASLGPARFVRCDAGCAADCGCRLARLPGREHRRVKFGPGRIDGALARPQHLGAGHDGRRQRGRDRRVGTSASQDSPDVASARVVDVAP